MSLKILPPQQFRSGLIAVPLSIPLIPLMFTSNMIAISIAVASMILMAFVTWWLVFRYDMVITGYGITWRAGLYSTSINWSEIQSIEVVTDKEEGIAAKKNAISIPGLALGWYENKRKRSIFVRIVAGYKVLSFKTLTNKDIYVSVSDPQSFFDLLFNLKLPNVEFKR